MALLPEDFEARRDEVHRLTRSAVRYSWWAIGISLFALVFSLVVALMN